jgi:hypothetical protein
MNKVPPRDMLQHASSLIAKMVQALDDPTIPYYYGPDDLITTYEHYQELTGETIAQGLVCMGKCITRNAKRLEGGE